MSENVNITGNLLEFINTIGQYWTRKKGLFLILVLEFFFLALFWNRIGFQSVIARGLFACGLVVITAIVWFITSKRILFRSGGFVLFWLLLSLIGAAAFYLLAYPNLIQNGEFDVPYIQLWGTVIVFFCFITVGFCIDFFVLKGRKLMIVFAVNNESVAVEKVIRDSIDPAVQHIQDEDNNIKLVVLPFGIIKSVRKSEKYIKFPLTRADAIIFARVIDDTDASPTSYLFTDFSSRINERRFVREEANSNMHKAVLDIHLRCRDWNYLNVANDNCSRKLRVSRNLEDMLKMYIGCIYLMKHDFKAAVPYANNAICNAPKNDASYNIASLLFSYALLSSAHVLENEDHEYDAALAQLNQLNRAMPVTTNDPGYNKAMARVMFYKGDIKASETYTKKFKNLPYHRWGYELNMGFYAINKKKVLEFVQHYKNLRKYYPCEKGEIDFAIDFLERQEGQSADKDYRILLRIAIAFLTLYKSPDKAHKLIKKVEYRSDNIKFVKAITDFNAIILHSKQKLEILPKKR